MRIIDGLHGVTMGRNPPVATLVCFISLIGCGYCHGNGIVPKLTQKENQCISKGASVTFVCDTGGSSSGWLFLWYKVVPLRDGLPAVTHQSGRSTYSLELQPDSSKGDGGSYTLNSTGTEHIGLYVCRAKKEDPVSYTEYSNYLFLWVSDPDSSGCLSKSPNRTNFVESESVSLTCGGNGTGWILKRISYYFEMSQCPFNTGASSWENGTCHIKDVSLYDSGVYWCQSESGEVSNAFFYIEVHGHGVVPRVNDDEGNQCLSKGASVTLTCAIYGSSTDWFFQWYRVVLLKDGLLADTHWPGKSTYSLELLPHSNAGLVGSYTINSTGLEHMGLYVCRAKKEEPVLHTDYSKPFFLRVHDPDSAASLSLIPDRTNYVQSESVSLTCEGNGTGWILKRITNYIEMSQCPFKTGASSWENGTCHIKDVSLYDSGVYWCQSESGEFTNVVSINVHDVRVYITHKAATWMDAEQFEVGDSIKLHCVVQSSSGAWTFLWYRVVPHRDGLLDAPRWKSDSRYSLEPLSDSGREAEGYYTLNSAVPEHSGVYVCRAEREEPVLHAYSPPKLIWVKDSSPPGLLHVSPNVKRFFENETVSFHCDVPENTNGWILRKYKNSEGPTDLHLKRETEEMSTFTIEYLNNSHSGVYWCQSESGKLTNIVNIPPVNKAIPRVQVFPDTWLALGESVSLNCDIDKSDLARWRFLWYKIVLYREDLLTFTDTHSRSKYSLQLVSESSSGTGGTYTLDSVRAEHSGLYVCRAEREQTTYHSEYSQPKLLWVTDSSPEAALIISSNRTQYFHSESLSLSCVAQADTGGWSLRRYTDSYPAAVSDCPFSETATWDQSTCNISSLAVSDSGVYWCESEFGQLSNLVKIKVDFGPRPYLQASPSTWPAKGQTVTLQCEVSGSKSGWRFLFYRLFLPSEIVTDLNRLEISENATELLSDSSRESGDAYTLTSVGPEHSGYYACRAERLNSSYRTPYGYPRHLWVIDPSPPASLSIHPNRSQYFQSESVILTCDVKGNSSGWTLRRFTHYNTASHCAFKHGSVTWNDTPCNLRYLRVTDSGHYWCQSESGEYSNAVNITVHGTPMTTLRAPPNDWLTEGASVTLTCMVILSQSSDWEYLWYKVVPPGEGKLIESRFPNTKMSVKPLLDDGGKSTGFYNRSSVVLQDSGIYLCQARRQNSDFHTEYSNAQPVWVTTPTPSAWLSISPNRSMHLQSGHLALRCVGPGHEAEWVVRRYTSAGELSDCPFETKSGTWAKSTCNMSLLSAQDSGVYWCQSTSGKLSNPVNISVHVPGTHYLYVRVSPSHWVTEGSAVTLSCSAEFGDLSSSKRFHWYKALPVTEGLPSFSRKYSETKYSVEVLSDSSRGAGGSYTVNSTSPKHSGLYVCRAEIQDLGMYTEYSSPELLVVTGRSPSAWLYVTPSRSQHFQSDPLTFSCKTKDSGTVWSVRRFTLWGELSDCPFNDKSKLLNPSTCNISSLTSSDSGVYWCQSESGERSNAVNITVHNGDVILESPVHPLRVGEQARLRCLGRKSTKSNFIATFYKDGLHVDNQTPGTMTILKASKSHEGWYSCKDEEQRKSPGSWISVKEAQDDRRGLRKRLFKGMYQRDKDML
ncbi:hypothetical protein ACEWY4_018146 [Coilia grayii]|uniref:Ig-like domain-containing protein n=1 Tax=Coilia grayii TaxID=363190 RepID=A0ABD1JJ47_9TELE